MNASEVLRACLHHWSYAQDTLIPRCCLSGWEADLLVIRKSGWAEEVEIKISAADFRAEFRKKQEKHEAFRLGVRRYVGPARSEARVLDGVDVSADPTLHLRESYPGHGSYYVRRPGIIRRFWFAMPAPLAEKLLPEVPSEYGVLAVGRYNQVLRKPANLALARKVTIEERVRALESTYYRFWAQELRGGLGVPALLGGPR